MADALLELEKNLRSRKEQLTTQEDTVFLRFKTRAVSQFITGAIAGWGLVWAATWKLHGLLRLNLSTGAAAALALWRFDSSLRSSVDQVLSLDGTRMQSELANIIVKKYRHDPWKMQLIAKHFYLEEVFDDSMSEPSLRWRYRNFFGDNVNQGQATHDDSQDVSHNATPGDIQNNFDRKRNDLRSKQIPVNYGTDLMADPLDCVFGYTTTSDEIHHSTRSSMPSKAQSRAHKRAHRRHRLHHQEGALGSHDGKHSKFDVM